MGEAQHGITIGIVNYNGAERTLATMGSVLAQGAGPSAVVIVDNASDEAGRAALRAGLPAGVTLVELPVNVGYAAGCNEIARRAIAIGSNFVWFLNNDLELETGVLAALAAALEADPSLFAVSAVTVDAGDPRLVLGAGADLSLWRARVNHRGLGLGRERLARRPYDVDMLEGACPLVRVAALRRTGGWDEGFFMYWEDAELSVRATRAGYRLRVVPTAFVRHVVAASSPREQREALMLRNRVRFTRIVNPRSLQALFLAYFALLWLPAYLGTHLVPCFGLVQGSRIAFGSLAWNLRDARRRGRWQLQSTDQLIPPLEGDLRDQAAESPTARAADRSERAG